MDKRCGPKVGWVWQVLEASPVAEPAASMDMIRLGVRAQGHETGCLHVEVTLLSGYK